jgi:transposase-like protein
MLVLDRGLIATRFVCPSCLQQCNWTSNSSKSDGHLWRCKRCNKDYSVRANSWFSGSRLSLSSMLRIMYYWTQEVEQGFTQHECALGSAGTICDFYHYCRQICFEILEQDNEMLGGPGVIVEVDEAKFGRRKFHRGARVDGVWIFGIVERCSNSTRCCLIPVASRDQDTLLPIISKFVAPRTVILSDCWKGYNGLEELGYTHMTVNHSKHFADPITGVNTNTIESLWNLLRRKMPRFGTTKEHYASYMIEFMYRRKYFSSIARGDRFLLFMQHIARLGFIWGD